MLLGSRINIVSSRKSSGVGNIPSPKAIFDYYATNYTNLLSVATSPVDGQIALVRNPEGTRFVGTIFGSPYYPNGIYIYNSGIWDSNKKAIQEALNEIGVDIDDLYSEISSNDSDIANLQSRQGWWNIKDTTYTSISPQSIVSNTRTKLQINLDSVIESFAPIGTTASQIWNDANNKFTPINLGDSYIFRLSFVANPSLNDRSLTVDLDIGGTEGIIWERSTRLSKGAGVDTKVSTTNSIFTLGTFVSNGGEFYITCNSDVDIHSINLFIQRVSST